MESGIATTRYIYKSSNTIAQWVSEGEVAGGFQYIYDSVFAFHPYSFTRVKTVQGNELSHKYQHRGIRFCKHGLYNYAKV